MALVDPADIPIRQNDELFRRQLNDRLGTLYANDTYLQGEIDANAASNSSVAWMAEADAQAGIAAASR